MDDRFERPHRDTTGYMMRAYAKMVYLRDLISGRKGEAIITKNASELARAKCDTAEIYSTSARYYQCMGDNERAVAYIDSTITAYKRAGIKADFAPIYATQSYLYEAMGEYKKALGAVRDSQQHPLQQAGRRGAKQPCRNADLVRRRPSWNSKSPG